MRELTDMLKNMLMLLIIVWAVFAFFLGIKMAPNDDMSPRISAGDVLFYYRIDKAPNARM
jgi:signal peptidase I